jgi:hypothetical protein
MKISRRLGLGLAGCALASLVAVNPGVARAQGTSLPEAVRQLTEAAQLISVGDYEGASRRLTTLAPQMAGDPATRPRAVQAYVLLATAQVALGFATDARTSFIAALRIDPGIRLTEQENSPKVVLVFNEALTEFRSTKKSSRSGLVLGGLGLGAAGAYLATRGGAAAPADTTAATLTNFRFTTPVVTCPDGVDSFPIMVGLAGDLTLPGPYPAALDAVQITLVITSSPGLPSEVGFSSSMAATVVPMTATLRTTSVTFSTTLVCGNGAGDAPRVNEFLARVSLATVRGLVTAETADRMRVNIP